MFTHKHESNDEKWRWRVNCCVYVPQWRAFISAFKREMFFFSFQRRPSMQGLIFNSIRIVVLFWAVRWGVEQQRDRGTRLKVTATFYVCWWIINTGIFSVIPTHLTLLSICVCVWALLGNLYNWPFHQEDLKRCVKSRSCTVLHYVPLCLPVYMQTEFSPRSEKDFRVYPFWFYLSFFSSSTKNLSTICIVANISSSLTCQQYRRKAKPNREFIKKKER